MFYLNNRIYIDFTWNMLCSPLSTGYFVLLNSNIVRWTDIWITNSMLNSFLLKVNKAFLDSSINSVSNWHLSKIGVLAKSCMERSLLLRFFLSSLAFSLEIMIIAGTSGKNTMIINLKNAFEIVFRLKNLFELVFDLRYKSAFKITRGLLKICKTF